MLLKLYAENHIIIEIRDRGTANCIHSTRAEPWRVNNSVISSFQTNNDGYE